jgi:alanine dehydrogenase
MHCRASGRGVRCSGFCAPVDDINPFDLVMIGGGSGGVRAARIAAGYGAKVALAVTPLHAVLRTSA